VARLFRPTTDVGNQLVELAAPSDVCDITSPNPALYLQLGKSFVARIPGLDYRRYRDAGSSVASNSWIISTMSPSDHIAGVGQRRLRELLDAFLEVDGR
jgi:hypothetical protein